MSLADIETALGMPLAEAKALLAAGKKPKEEPKGETLKGADLELAKMKALMQRNVPSGQIPVLLQFLNIAGTTLAEINASLEALAQAKMLPQEGQLQQGQGQQGGNANGAGNQGLQQQNGGKKIWTTSEVRELRLSGGITDKILEDLKKAEAEGRVKD
jgi:DNA-binding transcriptional MerR regulator